MTSTELAQAAQDSIRNTPQPMKPCVIFLMNGRWGKRNHRRLLGAKSPLGEIVQENPAGIVVIFDAVEVLDFCKENGFRGEETD